MKEWEYMRGEKTKQLWMNPKYKKQMSEAHKGLIGELSPSWKGGKKKAEERHKPKEKETSRLYRMKNKERIAVWNKGWNQRNKEKVSFYAKQHYRRKKGAEGTHTLGEWELLKKQYGFICPACGKGEPEIFLTEDHIIPLAKGGFNWIENIQPLCKSCNSKKHLEIIKYDSLYYKDMARGNIG